VDDQPAHHLTQVTDRPTIEVPAMPGSAAELRAFLAGTLKVDSMRAAEAALLVTELFANALQHGHASTAQVWVEDRGSTVRVGVSHKASGPITKDSPGFGFTVVEKMSQSWGTEFAHDTLNVWFELRRPGSLAMSPADLDEDQLFAGMGDEPLYAEELVQRYRPVAMSIARRYRGKGITDDDLEQVALIALLKAVHRFDPSRGALGSYAAVTVAGELKRQLRDRGWSVRVPRGLQEQALEVTRAIRTLTQELGRAPRVSEIATHLELPEAEVSEAMSVAQGYTAMSIEDPGVESGQPMSETLGELDAAFGDAETRGAIWEALETLPERDRVVVYLRFYEDLTQTEIAERVGVSQMQVSRILTRALSELGDLLSVE
jgi:RNA polymerase sigma-B factor